METVESLMVADAGADLPVSAAAARAITRHRNEIEAIIEQRDRRLLVVVCVPFTVLPVSGPSQVHYMQVGPCSVHDPAAAREYAQKLAVAAKKYKYATIHRVLAPSLLRAHCTRHRNELLVVMRVYFEKPRTTVGWKVAVVPATHVVYCRADA